MKIKKILHSLEKSCDRDEILLKIKNGLDADEIVNDFFASNELQIKELNTLLRPEDIDLLNQIEKLSVCESKLINKINNLNYLKNNEDHHILNEKNISSFNLFVAPFALIPSFLQANNILLLSTLRSLAILKIGVLIDIIFYL